MSAFLQVGFYAIILIIVFLCGLPLTLLINSKKLKESFIPLTLLLGTSVLIIISFWLSYIGLPFKKSCYLFLLLIFIINTFVIYLKRTTYKTLLKEGISKNPKLILLCIIAGGMALIPIVIYSAEFTYGDTYTYVCIADFLNNNGYRTPIQLDGYTPWLTQMALYQSKGLRIGAQMLLSLFTNILHREFSLELFAPTSALGVVLCGASVWFFLQQNYDLNRNTKWIGIILTVFNMPIIVWSSIFGFFPQLFGIVFFICALTMYLRIFKEHESVSVNVILCGVFIACTAFVYSEMIPFLVLDFIAIFIYKSVRNKKKFIYFVNITFICGLLAIALLGPYFISMFRAIISQFGTVVGGEQTMNWWSYIGYLLSTVSIGFNYNATGYSIIIKTIFSICTFTMLVFGAYGIKKISRNKNGKLIEEFLLLSLPFLLMLIYFTSFAKNPFGDGNGNSWGVYKLVQYYATIFIPYFSVFISEFIDKKKKILVIIGTILYISFNIMNVNYFSKNVTEPMRSSTGNQVNPIGEYYKLYSKYKNEDKKINLVGLPIEHRKMITYILRNNKLISNWSSDVYFGMFGTNPDPEYDTNGIILVYDTLAEGTIANLKEVDGGIVIAATGTGFYTSESDGINNWNWSQPVSELVITNISKSEKIEISFSAIVANNDSKDKTLFIYDADKILAEIKLTGTELTHTKLELEISKQSEKKIRFVYNGDVKASNELDSRELSFGIWNLSTKTID
jgi:hypothetical protein